MPPPRLKGIRHHRYIEIGSGLNYFDAATGGYLPSQDLIELTPDGGAAALRGPAQLYLNANLNTQGAITIVTTKGRTVTTRPLGIFWYDAQSGNRELVASVQDCIGELLPPNQVVWRAAFGALADLRITYTKSAIESDLILLQQPPLPDGWNSTAARLELWHQWIGAGQPTVTLRLLRAETNANLRPMMVEPEVTDQILDFGDLWFPTGAAYATATTPRLPQNQARQVLIPNLTNDGRMEPVAKSWLTTPTQTILIEAVSWQTVQAKLAALPMLKPSATVPTVDRVDLLNDLLSQNSDSGSVARIKTATTDYHPTGFVLDYITVPTSYGSPYTFDSSTTYFVNSPTYFSSTVTFQPGCIIKFNGNYLLFNGSIVCNGSSANPSLLTDYHENLWGEKISSPDANSGWSCVLSLPGRMVLLSLIEPFY